MNAPDLPPDEVPLPLPIGWELDLHTFRPQDIGDLVPDYLAECQARGILQVRIIHGKGIGQLRQTVHAILARHPDVISFSVAGSDYGGSGATIVNLRPGCSGTPPATSGAAGT